MENNRYAQNRHEIDRISREKGVDIGVACAMLRDKKGWSFKDGIDTEITEFCDYVRSMNPEEVQAYFEG